MFTVVVNAELYNVQYLVKERSYSETDKTGPMGYVFSVHGRFILFIYLLKYIYTRLANYIAVFFLGVQLKK